MPLSSPARLAGSLRHPQLLARSTIAARWVLGAVVLAGATLTTAAARADAALNLQGVRVALQSLQGRGFLVTVEAAGSLPDGRVELRNVVIADEQQPDLQLTVQRATVGTAEVVTGVPVALSDIVLETVRRTGQPALAADRVQIARLVTDPLLDRLRNDLTFWEGLSLLAGAARGDVTLERLRAGGASNLFAAGVRLSLSSDGQAAPGPDGSIALGGLEVRGLRLDVVSAVGTIITSASHLTAPALAVTPAMLAGAQSLPALEARDLMVQTLPYLVAGQQDRTPQIRSVLRAAHLRLAPGDAPPPGTYGSIDGQAVELVAFRLDRTMMVAADTFSLTRSGTREQGRASLEAGGARLHYQSLRDDQSLILEHPLAVLVGHNNILSLDGDVAASLSWNGPSLEVAPLALTLNGLASLQVELSLEGAVGVLLGPLLGFEPALADNLETLLVARVQVTLRDLGLLDRWQQFSQARLRGPGYPTTPLPSLYTLVNRLADSLSRDVHQALARGLYQTGAFQVTLTPPMALPVAVVLARLGQVGSSPDLVAETFRWEAQTLGPDPGAPR